MPFLLKKTAKIRENIGSQKKLGNMPRYTSLKKSLRGRKDSALLARDDVRLGRSTGFLNASRDTRPTLTLQID